MIASVHSASVLGARGHRVGVEVHVGPGLPSFTMLGLPDESCREARDRVQCAGVSVARRVEGCRRSGVEVTVPGDVDYPSALLDDPERPAVLFVRGDVSLWSARRVGVVGTRNSTAAGRATAAHLGG
ncbi:MAG: DNA-processing protein DprA, partial [Ilumatobacteraceae bacterium]